PLKRKSVQTQDARVPPRLAQGQAVAGPAYLALRQGRGRKPAMQSFDHASQPRPQTHPSFGGCRRGLGSRSSDIDLPVRNLPPAQWGAAGALPSPAQRRFAFDPAGTDLDRATLPANIGQRKPTVAQSLVAGKAQSMAFSGQAKRRTQPPRKAGERDEGESQ